MQPLRLCCSRCLNLLAASLDTLPKETCKRTGGPWNNTCNIRNYNSFEAQLSTLELSYFGYMMKIWEDDTMLGKVEGKRRGQPAARWMSSITVAMGGTNEFEGLAKRPIIMDKIYLCGPLEWHIINQLIHVCDSFSVLKNALCCSSKTIDSSQKRRFQGGPSLLAAKGLFGLPLWVPLHEYQGLHDLFIFKKGVCAQKCADKHC